MKEIIERIRSNIDQIIDNTYAILFSFTSVINEKDIDIFERFGRLASRQQEYWNYKDMLLIDYEGNAYNTKGESIVLSHDIYLRNTVLKGEQYMSPLQVVDRQESSIFAVPLG